MEVPKSTLYTYSNDYWKSNTFFLAEFKAKTTSQVAEKDLNN